MHARKLSGLDSLYMIKELRFLAAEFKLFIRVLRRMQNCVGRFTGR